MTGSPEQPEDRPRLLFASPLPPPAGGISGWTQRVVTSPLAEAFHVEVVNTSPRDTTAVDGGSRFRLDRAGHALGLLLDLLRRVRRFRPQLVHVNTSYYWAFYRDGLMLWIASFFGARTLMHFRGGDFQLFHQGCPAVLRWFVTATLRRADGLLAVTRETERYLRDDVGLAQVQYLPNFAGEPRGQASPADGDRVEVLFVGWMLAAKGVRELLAAARAIPEARFTLVGPADPAFLESLADELAALEGRVEYLGSRTHAEVLALYPQADLFVLPTWREGFPNVVVEAMAAGLPVVSTRVGAIPDTVRDGVDGYLIEARDAAALEQKLRELVADPERRREMGASARRRFEECFSAAAVLGELQRIYRSLITPGG